MAVIYVPKGLPAAVELTKEGLDVRDTPCPQDVICKRILLLNLMPLKEATERQLLRLFSGSDENLEFIPVKTFSYTSRNTSAEHLERFYFPTTDPFIQNGFFDGMILTGAPVEQLDFTQVVYWEELCGVLEWAKTHVKSVYSICWGAQAALKILYGKDKYLTKDKLFGLFRVGLTEASADSSLCAGMPRFFTAPQSRYAYVKREEIISDSRLTVLAEGREAGIHIAASRDGKLICVFGHPEYERETLSGEYFRDLNKGDDIVFPHEYFVNGNPSQLPDPVWQQAGRIFAANWVKKL